MKLRSGKHASANKYYNALYPGSFSGAQSFKLPNHSRNKIAQYLSTQDTYTLYKPVVRRFKRRAVICRNKFDTLEADLVDLSSLSRQNSGVKFLLTVICCYSRFAFVRLLKNKKSSSAISALKTGGDLAHIFCWC